MWEGVVDRTVLQHISPHSFGHNRVSFPFSRNAQPGAWGPSLSGCCFSLPHLISNSSDPRLIWSPNSQSGAWGLPLLDASFLPHLVSNWLNFLCTELYNSTTSTFFLWTWQIALIQPVHGQGYILILLEWMHLLFTQVNFLFWQANIQQVYNMAYVISMIQFLHTVKRLEAFLSNPNNSI